MLICIDPGHSGPIEPGAVAGGCTEADLNLAIAKLVGSELIASGHEVLYTRKGDIVHVIIYKSRDRLKTIKEQVSGHSGR